MKAKKYNSNEKPLPQVEEPVATYGTTAAINNEAVTSSIASESLYEKPEKFDACYAKLKAEADEKFGKNKRMTVDEYFGKLWYMVNAYYDNVQDQD